MKRETEIVFRSFAYAWALPTTCVGMIFVLPALLHKPWRKRMRLIDGVLEIHGGAVSVFLRRGTLLRGGASAMTFGHIVLGVDQFALEHTRAHERVHVKQAERWGPLFIPAYLLASAIAWMRGRDPYRDNPFEREAFAISH